jgi:hypothetical protein
MKNVRTFWHRIGWIVCFILACAFSASAQFDSAQISGLVRDQAGAVIPGVTVSIVNAGTSQQRETVTNEQGFYLLPNVPVGTYTVTAELPGFKKFVKTGVQLNAAINIRVDIDLAVGNISEVVEVQATTNEVVAETSVIGRSVGSQEIAQLPLAGRNVALAAQLKAGVTGGRIGANLNSGTNAISAGGYNINGGRSDEYVTTVDGALSIRVRAAGGFSMGAQNIDTVEEVQVLTTNYQAEYGRASGGILRVVTKSGTQEFHGKLFEVHQNTALNANSWTRNSSGNPRLSNTQEPIKYNSFGFAIGGPIYIPGKFNADKKKLFFYLGEEWDRTRDESLQQGIVPSLAMRRGDFSELLNPANPFFNRARVINDPVTKQPFQNNIIPPERISPNGRALLSAYAEPTPGYLQGSNNYIRSFRTWDNQRKDSLKIDYIINDKHRLAVRHTWFPHIWNVINGPIPLYSTIWQYPNRTAVFTFTSTLSPTFINEFTASYGSTVPGRFYGELMCPPGKCVKNNDRYPVRSTSGLTYPLLFPGTKLDPEKMPSISVQGVSAAGTTLNAYPGEWNDFVYVLGDNMTKIVHSHTLKWGVAIETSGMNDQIQFSFANAPATTNQNGSFRFFDSGNPNTTGLAIANVLLGDFDDYTEFNSKPRTPWVTTAFDGFFQDSWKATRKLTVEAGVRYSLWPPWGTSDNTISMFHSGFYDSAVAPVVDRTGGFIVSGDRFDGVVIPGCKPTAQAIKKFPVLGTGQFDRLYHCLPRGFSEIRKNGFQPRFGFAYGLNAKTSIRAGAGMFLNRVQINTTGAPGGNPPFMEMQTVINGRVDSPVEAQRRDFPLTLNMQDPVLKTPTAWAWNATVERELPGTTKISAAYVGRRGYYLERSRNINQLLPGTVQANPGVNVNFLRPFRGLGAISLFENSGNSKYNALQLQFDRRSARGIGISASYTFSRTTDNGSARGTVLPNAYDDKAFYGISDIDRPHVALINYYYNLPTLRSLPRVLGYVLGNWGISGVNQFQSGSPFSVTTTEDIAGVGAGSGSQFYTLVGDPKNVTRTDLTSTPAIWFNKDAFARPTAGTYGVQPRNSLRNPGFWDMHLSVRRSFPVTETHRFDLRWEAFNALNHPTLGNANSNPTLGSFGTITSKTGNRTMQINLQYLF